VRSEVSGAASIELAYAVVDKPPDVPAAAKKARRREPARDDDHERPRLRSATALIAAAM
jgi:hypothetical protein